MIKLGEEAITAAEESLERLENRLKEMDLNEVLRQDSVCAEFAVAELLEAISNIRSVYEVDFTYIYETDDTDEDLTEVEGLDNFYIEFSVDEEIAEGPIEYISGWIEHDITYEIIEEHNTQVQFNLADEEENEEN